MPGLPDLLGNLAGGLLGALRPATAYAHGLPMDLYLVDAEGGEPKRLTRLGLDSPAAAWAPDGKRVAFVCGGGIYLLSLGGTARPIAQQGGHSFMDWRPA